MTQEVGKEDSIFETYGKLMVQKELLDNQINECKKKINVALEAENKKKLSVPTGTIPVPTGPAGGATGPTGPAK